MLDKRYTIISHTGEFYSDFNITDVLYEFTKNFLNHDWQILNNVKTDFIKQFGTEFIFSDSGAFSHKYVDEMTVYVNCKYIILDGLGNIINPLSLQKEYFKFINFSKIKNRVLKDYEKRMLSCGSKGSSISNRRKIFRKPRNSSLMNEIKEGFNSIEQGIVPRKSRINNLKMFAFEERCNIRFDTKGWKDVKKIRKQWEKKLS